MSETEKIPQEIPQDIDLLRRGMEIIRAHDAKVQPDSAWLKNGVYFIQKLDPRSVQRINAYRINDKSNPSDWAIGQALVGGLGLRAVVDESMASGALEHKAAVSAQLPQAVSIVQDELLALANSLDMSKFEARKEISKYVSQLNAAMQTGLLVLSPKDADEKSATAPQNQEPQNVYQRQFYDLSFYRHFIETKTYHSDLDQFARAVLEWLADDWTKNVGGILSPPPVIAALYADSYALFLKIAFDGRQLFRTRPLSSHLGLIQPAFKELLAASLSQRKKLKDTFEFPSKESTKDQLMVLKRAHAHIARATEEFEAFLADLPKSKKEAERYYSEFRFRLPERLSPSTKKKPPPIVGKAGPRPLSLSGRIRSSLPWKYLAILLPMTAALVYANWEEWGPALQFWRGRSLGKDLGVRDIRVSDNRWTGTFTGARWAQYRDHDKVRLANQLLDLVAKDGFEGMDLVDENGVLLASSIYVGEKMIVRVEGVNMNLLHPQGLEGQDLQGLRAK